MVRIITPTALVISACNVLLRRPTIIVYPFLATCSLVGLIGALSFFVYVYTIEGEPPEMMFIDPFRFIEVE